MKSRVEKFKLEDVYKFLFWFFNGKKKPSYISNLKISKNETLNFFIIKNFNIKKRLPFVGRKIKFHERLDILSLPTVFTRDVHIEEISPNLSFITEENLNFVFFIKLEQLYDSKIFINSYADIKCPNKNELFTKSTPFFLVSVDLEMVYSKRGKEVGRVSILDHLGNVQYDKYVKPDYPVLDYCTMYSGLTPELLDKGISTKQMKEEIQNIIGKNTVILGHGLDNDMTALEIYHPHIIDTSYIFLNTESRRVSLKQLANRYLKRKVHEEAHSSVEDAKICLELLSIKIQQIKSASDKNTKEIWLQAHIYHHNTLSTLINSPERGFNVCLVDHEDIRRNYRAKDNATDVFIYKDCDKIIIEL